MRAGHGFGLREGAAPSGPEGEGVLGVGGRESWLSQKWNLE